MLFCQLNYPRSQSCSYSSRRSYCRMRPVDIMERAPMWACSISQKALLMSAYFLHLRSICRAVSIPPPHLHLGIWISGTLHSYRKARNPILSVLIYVVIELTDFLIPAYIFNISCNGVGYMDRRASPFFVRTLTNESLIGKVLLAID